MMMGEAARRKAAIEALKTRNVLWLASLSPVEQLIANAAQRAYDGIVVGLGMTEGCYHLAFFLREYVRLQHSIELDVIVGWVNDGQWDGATSHAWLEYEGKKIDISLHRTSHPDAQPPGDLVVLDHAIRKGAVTYQYWVVLPERARFALKQMEEDSPELSALIRKKADEHQRMVEFSKSPNGAAEYLSQAPSEGSYAALLRRM
jgi:hypothetical protein